MINGMFILSLLLLAGSCASPQVQNIPNAFYLGLKEADTEQKIKLYEKALSSPNEYERQSAAEELAILMSRGSALSPTTIRAVRREVRGFWAEAFEAANNITKEKVISFLLNNNLNTASFHEARQFILKESSKSRIVFSEDEKAVIYGHYSAVRSRYNEAMEYYSSLQKKPANDSGTSAQSWPEQIPELFIQYPNTIIYLGRTFQYTSSGNTGTNLFLNWKTELSNRNDASLQLPCYNLLYSAARIARARGQSSVSIFEQALAIAPNNEQLDICIWNIFDRSVEAGGNTFIDRLRKYVPHWHDGSFFNDVMERYMQRLTAAQDWNRIIQIFNLIKNTDANVPKAASAWLIERAIEEKLLSSEDSRLAAQAVSARTADPVLFARIAYNASYSISIPSLYYRYRTASVLKLPFLEFPESNKDNSQSSQVVLQSSALQFLYNFFKYGLADLADPYIRSMERDLSPAELRVLSQAYAEEEMYNLSMRLIAVFINRKDYSPEKRDLELAYPRPFSDLIELYARKYNHKPSLMFGLIRAESAFRPAVVSHAGAVGLAQFMPRTAEDVAGRIYRAGGPNYAGPEYNNLDRTIPEVSVHMGSYYLNMRRNQLNDVQLALMAYNGGVPRVQRAQRANPKLPPDLIVETHPVYETRDYGRRVTGFAAVYEALYY